MNEAIKKELLETLRELVLTCWEGLDRWTEKNPTRSELQALEEDIMRHIKSLRSNRHLLWTIGGNADKNQ